MKLKSFRSPEAIFNARNRNLFHCLFISVALILSSVANDLVAQSKGPAAGNGNASTLLQQKTGQGFEPLSYCTATNICDPTLYISRVVFGSLDNSSACSALGYGDYTTSVAAPAIEAGKTTILSITIPTAQFNMIGAWIDLNKNNSFEANEFFFIGSTAGGVINTPISIPLSTSPGQTRMRIRRLYYSNPMTFDMACGMNGYPGETEDYTINIVVPKVAFIHTPLSNPDTLYKPTITISATILQSDAGINNSDSLKPRLWARKVGSTSWKQVKGNLVSGNVTNGNWDFVISHDSLGIRKNDCEQVQYYFVAQDVNNPSNIGYDPSPGAQHTNVQTQVTPPSQLYSYRLKPWLKDTIYINANGCGFQSLTNDNGVFNSINNKGLDGDLTVMIESDLTEKGNYELNGTKLNGYRLTIRPYGNTLRTITQDAIGDTQMVQLNGVKNFTIDGSYQGNGRYLRFVQKPLVSYKDSISAIRIYNSCDSIYIRNCVFDHNGNATIVDSSSSTIWIGRGTNKNIDLRGNLFRGGGGEFPCRHLVSTEGNNNATVIRNEFTNFKENGIRISSGNNWIIDSNHFYRTATYTASG